MSAIDTTLEALRGALAVAFSGCLVTRSFRPLAIIPKEELLQGVVTLVSRGEGNYANYLGREAQLGTMRPLLLFQFELPGNPSGLQVEQRELDFVEALKNFMSGPMPAGVAQCLMNGFEQSGQLETPMGWVGCELEVMSDE